MEGKGMKIVSGLGGRASPAIRQGQGEAAASGSTLVGVLSALLPSSEVEKQQHHQHQFQARSCLFWTSSHLKLS